MTAVASVAGRSIELQGLDVRLSLRDSSAVLKFPASALAGAQLDVPLSAAAAPGEPPIFSGELVELVRDIDAGTITIEARGPAMTREDAAEVRSLTLHGARLTTRPHEASIVVALTVVPVPIITTGPGGLPQVQASSQLAELTVSWPPRAPAEWPVYRYVIRASSKRWLEPDLLATAKALYAELSTGWMQATGETDARDILPGDRVRVVDLELIIVEVHHRLAEGTIATSITASALPPPARHEVALCVAAPVPIPVVPAGPPAPAPEPPPVHLTTRWAIEELGRRQLLGLPIK